MSESERYRTPLIRSLVVAEMCRRLRETDDLCKEISIDACGRDDCGSRLFKQIMGMTMEQYRVKIRAKRGKR